MTNQACDYFLQEGKRYPIDALPKTSTFLREFEDTSSELQFHDSNLHRGYIAEWTVKDKKLYLNDIIFGHDLRVEKKPLFAYWVTGPVIYDLLSVPSEADEHDGYRYCGVNVEEGNVFEEFVYADRPPFGLLSMRMGEQIFPRKDAETLEGYSGRARYKDAKGIYHGELLNGVRSGFGHYQGIEGRQNVKRLLPKPKGRVNLIKGKLSELKFWGGWFFSPAPQSINSNWYKGVWKDGLRDGSGTCDYWVAGMQYIGEWKEDLFHGSGKLTLDGGKVFEGQWEKGIYSGMF